MIKYEANMRYLLPYVWTCLFVYLIETVCSNRDTLVVKALNGGIAV